MTEPVALEVVVGDLDDALRAELEANLIALRVLVGSSDPVRRCDEDSAVRRALCR